jgi:replicative DNA helicase
MVTNAPISPGDVLLGRVPPQSLEAEMAVLGSMMLDPSAVGEVIEQIDAQAFYKKNHQLIFDALVDLYLTQRKCDLVTLKAELERRGLQPRLQAGGPGDTPNYVSFHVKDPDGFEVQISGVARPGDSLYKKA